MRRSFLLVILLVGAAVGTTPAQESPLPTPAPADQTNKPRAKSPLTEEQRAQMEQRLNDAWAKMPVETKSRLMRLHRALSEMPPDERKFVHDRIERFLNMSQSEREKLKQNKQKWEQMTPEERQAAREEFRKHRQEFEQQWHRTHPSEDPTPNPSNETKTPSSPEDNSAPSPAPSPAP
jgi:Spy/CpxP family protein refolding chaperone